MLGHVPPLIRWVHGASLGNFLKLDCLRVHFKTLFKPISVILQASFSFILVISNVSILRDFFKHNMASLKVIHSFFFFVF